MEEIKWRVNFVTSNQVFIYIYFNLKIDKFFNNFIYV